MSTKKWNDILSAPARMLLAFILVFGQTAWAMQGQDAKDKPGSNAAAKPQQTPPNRSTAGSKAQPAEGEAATSENSSAKEDSQRGGQHEDIKVHGHWTLEVRDPDGSVVTHSEFENSLAGGAASLAICLVNGCSQPVWQIVLYQASPMTICNVPPNLNPLYCSVSASAAIQNQTQVLLTATTTAKAAGSITQVQTLFGGPFTSTTITPVAVAGGQIVQLSVTISFS